MLVASIEAYGNDREVLFRRLGRLEQALEAACDNGHLVRALASMRSQCHRLLYLQEDLLDLSRWSQLHCDLASAVADGEGAGAIRAQDEIIATLESLVNALDVFS